VGYIDERLECLEQKLKESETGLGWDAVMPRLLQKGVSGYC
jgi:hypothetical protein